MLKLPNLEKNAYLSIFIKGDSILANLAYVDYTSGRSYILSDVTLISSIEDVLQSDQFWNQYFDQISKKYNWEIFRGREIMKVVAEGIGVSGVSVFYSNKFVKFDQIISKIREISFDINFISIDTEYINTITTGIASRLNYKDVLYVNIDLRSFSIYRASLNAKKVMLSSSRKNLYETCVSNIDWDQKSSLVQNIHNSKLRAFFSLDLEDRKLSNTWANFVNRPITKTNSTLLKDIIRSFISVQLITMINESNGKLDNIGDNGETLVVLCGDLVDILDIKQLALSILDGLELRGSIDLLLDKYGRILTLGREFTQGIESQNFVFSPNDLFKDMYKLVVGEIKDTKQQKKVIFTGKSEFSHKGVEDIYALAPEISVFEIDNKKGFVSGKFVQGNTWGRDFVDFEVFSDPANVSYRSLIIDGRPKPIVYGPDSRNNRSKLSAWINETC